MAFFFWNAYPNDKAFLLFIINSDVIFFVNALVPFRLSPFYQVTPGKTHYVVIQIIIILQQSYLKVIS